LPSLFQAFPFLFSFCHGHARVSPRARLFFPSPLRAFRDRGILITSRVFIVLEQLFLLFHRRHLVSHFLSLANIFRRPFSDLARVLRGVRDCAEEALSVERSQRVSVDFSLFPRCLSRFRSQAFFSRPGLFLRRGSTESDVGTRSRSTNYVPCCSRPELHRRVFLLSRTSFPNPLRVVPSCDLVRTTPFMIEGQWNPGFLFHGNVFLFFWLFFKGNVGTPFLFFSQPPVSVPGRRLLLQVPSL